MRAKISLIIGLLTGHFTGLFLPLGASAVSKTVIISGLQTASLNSTSDEFIELLNPTANSIDISGWQLQYRSASAANGTDCTKGWGTKATIGSSSIEPGGHYSLTSGGYLNGSTSFTAGLASAAGTVRVIDGTKTAIDALAWGGASCGLGAPAPAPDAGQSLVRKSGLDGEHADNSSDFFAQTFPFVAPAPIFASPAPGAATDPAIGSGSGLPPRLILSELLVDPVAPQTDAADEFVEIYNAGSDPIEGEGYAVQSGTHQYKLPKGTIAPGAYVVVTSAQSSLSLSNSGGVANLLDPTGTVIDTAGVWGAAVPGSSWAFADDTWRWTITPTPGAANVYTPQPTPDAPTDFAAVELSELLPDPASPMTDANDEFIEIYNPTDQPVDLTGYVLKAGHDLTGKYVISGVSVAPEGYVALKSSQTKLALSNSGSSVALYTPDGIQLGLTITYPKAGSGNAWARLNGNWDWTAEPSPGSENIISPVAVVPPKTAAAVKSPKPAKSAVLKTAAKTSTAKPKATPKVKAAKTTKAKSPVKSLLAGTTSPGGRWLLYVLAGLTLAYIIYEFRYDIRNYYYKLRGYPVGRPAPVPVAIGRGSDRAN